MVQRSSLRILANEKQRTLGMMQFLQRTILPDDGHADVVGIEEQGLGSEAQMARQPRRAGPVALHGRGPRRGGAPVADIVLALLPAAVESCLYVVTIDVQTT